MIKTIKSYNKIRTFFVSYAASGGSLIIGSAAQLLTFAILARFLGVDEFSIFVTLTALASIAVHLCGLGGMECLVRRVARDPAMYPVMLGHNIILTATSGSFLVIAGILSLPFFFHLSENNLVNVLSISLILITNILFVRVIVLSEQIFIAHSDFGSANKIVVGFAVARTIAAALACLVFDVTTVASWAVWQFAAHVVVASFCFWVVRDLGRPRFEVVREELPQGLYFSLPFILRAARQNADLLVLNIVATSEIVASYSVARKIFESSYLSVEALNRLIYPGSAKVSSAGLHHAVERIRQVLIAAAFISTLAAIAVFILAPVLPYLFGQQYYSLIDFVRILCWAVIPMAIWSVAVEALGASGRHAIRASIMGGASVLGAALIALATWFYPPEGTFVAFYVIEIATMIAAWIALLYCIKGDRACFPDETK